MIFPDVSVTVHDSTFAACVVIVARSVCDASPETTLYARAVAVDADVATAEVSRPPDVPSIDVNATEVAVTAVSDAPSEAVNDVVNTPLLVAVIVNDSDVVLELSARK